MRKALAAALGAGLMATMAVPALAAPPVPDGPGAGGLGAFPMIMAAGIAIYLDAHQYPPCPAGYHYGTDLSDNSTKCFSDDMKGRIAPFVH